MIVVTLMAIVLAIMTPTIIPPIIPPATTITVQTASKQAAVVVMTI